MRYIGIDVSKDKLDVAFRDGKKVINKCYKNNSIGFELLIAECPKYSRYIFEATGVYHHRLAQYLHSKKKHLVIVNAFKVKRFGDSEAGRSKNDRLDSILIMKYGEQKSPARSVPPSKWLIHHRRKMTILDLLIKQNCSWKRSLSIEQHGIANKANNQFIQTHIKDNDLKINILLKQLKTSLNAKYNQQLKRLMTIPGIGLKTAIRFTLLFEDLKSSYTSRDIISYCGQAPRIKQSGSSVYKNLGISKMGGKKIRSSLYVCARQALKHNKSCIAMYERLEQAGKPHKVIKVAIMNKLLRQMYSVVKSGGEYDEDLSLGKVL